jgi:hypothetical protein
MKRALAGLLLGLLIPWAAHATEALAEGFVLQSDRDALACLTPAPADRKPIEYPEDAKRFKQSAKVRVSLEFHHPGKPPRATILTHAGDFRFDAAVEDYVSAYRLPCLRPEAAGTVTATQDFEFTPDDGRPIKWRPLLKTNPDVQSENCKVQFPEIPGYPSGAGRSGSTYAALLVEMKFRGPTQPPVVTYPYKDATRPFVETVTRWASGVRIPCLKEDEVVTAARMFHFRIEDSAGIVLKDLSLQQLVPVIDKLDEHHVYFDFNAMGCPFDVRMHLYQPFLTNPVGEIGSNDPRRAEFLDWLAKISLKLPYKALGQVLGTPMTVSVPCTQLDLR